MVKDALIWYQTWKVHFGRYFKKYLFKQNTGTVQIVMNYAPFVNEIINYINQLVSNKVPPPR